VRPLTLDLDAAPEDGWVWLSAGVTFGKGRLATYSNHLFEVGQEHGVSLIGVDGGLTLCGLQPTSVQSHSDATAMRCPECSRLAGHGEIRRRRRPRTIDLDDEAV
jgi:hypothetical protein